MRDLAFYKKRRSISPIDDRRSTGTEIDQVSGRVEKNRSRYVVFRLGYGNSKKHEQATSTSAASILDLKSKTPLIQWHILSVLRIRQYHVQCAKIPLHTFAQGPA